MRFSGQRCAVTGANGYVGSRISECFATRGWEVFEFTRRPRPDLPLNVFHVPFQLESPLEPNIFEDNGIRVLIHCAYDFRPSKWENIRGTNVEGSKHLLSAAKRAGVDKIIFISTISAFEGCSSLYGKAKLEIEKVATDLGALIVRPGLVFGDRPSNGMFGSLQRSITRCSIVPLIGSGQYVQYLVHEQDLCELVLRLTHEDVSPPQGPIVAASPRGWKMRELLSAMAAASQVRVKFIPLPWRAVWLSLKLSELLGIPVPFRSDSVISLVRQNPNPDFSLTNQFGFRLREFRSGYANASSVEPIETTHGGS